MADIAGTAQEVYQQFRKYGDLADPHAEELARLKTLIAEYEQSSHFTVGAVKFTVLAAGTDTECAYQVYLADEP